MIIRDENIIRAEQELDELEKFRKSNIMVSYDNENLKHGSALLHDTINKKKKVLCELYIDKMKRYLE